MLARRTSASSCWERICTNLTAALSKSRKDYPRITRIGSSPRPSVRPAWARASGWPWLVVRPVVEIMFADFVTLAFDQIYNHAAKFPVCSNMRVSLLVIRMPAAVRWLWPDPQPEPRKPADRRAWADGYIPECERHAPGQSLRRAALECQQPNHLS